MIRTSSVDQSARGRKRSHVSCSPARPSSKASSARAPQVENQRIALTEEDERQQMIAEGAYYRAERRGFRPGGELIDWLAAEQEVDAMLNEPYDDGESPLV